MPTENTSAPMRSFNQWIVPGAIVIAALIIAIGLYAGLSSKGGTTAQGNNQQPAKAVNVKDIKTDGDPYVGNANAPVTLVYWFDYQCPFCKAFDVGGVSQIPVEPAMPVLKEKYVDTGKLKIVFKNFAFLGNDSVTAAEYSDAVWNLYPDQFFAWNTAMMKAQDEEGDQGFGNAVSIDALIKAQFPKMDAAKVKADVIANKAKYDAQTQADMQEASALGINGTPGFVTGTQLISGLSDAATFESAIDAQLK